MNHVNNIYSVEKGVDDKTALGFESGRGVLNENYCMLVPTIGL